MHTTEKKDEGNSFKGKVVAFFDIEQDPLVKAFKKKVEPEEENKTEWGYSR